MLEETEKILGRDPDNAYVWGDKGRALEDLGRRQEALSAFEKAIERNPNNAFLWGSKGHALGNLGRHQEAFAQVTRFAVTALCIVIFQMNV